MNKMFTNYSYVEIHWVSKMILKSSQEDFPVQVYGRFCYEDKVYLQDQKRIFLPPGRMAILTREMKSIWYFPYLQFHSFS